MSYLSTIHPQETDELLVSLRAFAEHRNIPIIDLESARFLKQLLKLKHCETVLEIGTAIGYTAIMMAKEPGVRHVTTLERDQRMADTARRHIAHSGLEDVIVLLEEDALTVNFDGLPKTQYDLLFIDGAKAQNINFFEKYEHLLSPGGIALVDNVLFHGLIEENIRSKNLRQLLRKIDAFNQYIMTRRDYDVAIHNIGDGLCLIIKKEGSS